VQIPYFGGVPLRQNSTEIEMATIEYWIQIENRPWDMSPHNIDRMTGRTMQQITLEGVVNRTNQILHVNPTPPLPAIAYFAA